MVLIWCGHLLFLKVLSLNARAWQSADSDPDIDDFPETSYLLSRSNTAIGFSGGGETMELAEKLCTRTKISTMNRILDQFCQ